ncbi:MAG TPA: hypothetical protein V6D19_17855 [Stenomitos sp.]
MKSLKFVVVCLVCLFALMFSPPSWADAGRFLKTPEYAEVTQAIADVLNPANPLGLKPEAIAPKLADLRFQKYILETADDRAQVSNQTQQDLAVYAKPKKTSGDPKLYHLAAGQQLDDDYDFSGIYIPSNSKITLDPTAADTQLTSAAIALKFVPGTQLIATANPETGALEFNAPALSVAKANETSWVLPDLTQSDIASQTPSAPTD